MKYQSYNKKPPKLIMVEWNDAHSTDEWTNIEELDDGMMVCRSVGYLVQETKRSISIAGTVSNDGQACCVIHIPRAWIKKITKPQPIRFKV